MIVRHEKHCNSKRYRFTIGPETCSRRFSSYYCEQELERRHDIRKNIFKHSSKQRFLRESAQKHVQTTHVKSKKIQDLSLSQAAACDGTRITTTTVGQNVAPGTLPIY